MSAFNLSRFLEEFSAEAERRGFHSETLWETDAGPIKAYRIEGEGAPAYLSAGMHGDEPAGPLAALRLLKEGFFQDGRPWFVCPALNPTGLVAGIRENADGIDLNRDYLTLETPEIAAHVNWLRTLPAPDLFLSLHEDWESTGFYFYEINAGEDRPERAQGILDAVGEWLPPEPQPVIDEHETRSPGWIYHGTEPDFPDHWPEAIYIAKAGCPLSFTFETPSSKDIASRVAAHVAAVKRAAIR